MADSGALDLLDLEVTRRCNLACRTCWVVGVRPEIVDMTTERAVAAMRWARPRSGAMLHLSGGEPFLLPHLVEILEAGAEAGFDRLVVNTNGVAIPPRRVEPLAARRERLDVEVSLDGPAELHEEIRGPGSHERTADAIDRLLAAEVRVALFVTVTRPLVPRLADWLAGCLERWPSLHLVALLPVGDPGTGQPLARPLDRDDLLRLNQVPAAAMMHGLGVLVAGNPAACLPLRHAGWPNAFFYRCTAASTRACVLGDGTVTPCHPVPTPIGHMDEQTVDEVLAGPLARRIAAHDFDGCRDCQHRMACGGCRAYTLADGRPIDGWDPVCERLCEGEDLRENPGKSDS